MPKKVKKTMHLKDGDKGSKSSSERADASVKINVVTAPRLKFLLLHKPRLGCRLSHPLYRLSTGGVTRNEGFI